jgi:hypothetical protein
MQQIIHVGDRKTVEVSRSPGIVSAECADHSVDRSSHHPGSHVVTAAWAQINAWAVTGAAGRLAGFIDDPSWWALDIDMTTRCGFIKHSSMLRPLR